MDLERLYSKLPVFAQNLACGYYGWQERKIRMGDEFFSRYNWLLVTESYSRQEIEAYQDDQITALAEHAYLTVPYYHRLFDEHGLKPQDIRSRKDLLKLPFLRKENIVKNHNDLYSEDPDQNDHIERCTSGSTGKALKFASSPASIAFQWAVWWRHRHRFGVEPFEWHVNFTGKRVVPPGQSGPPFWRYNHPMRQALVNMHHIVPKNIGAIADFLNGCECKYYSGYPSIIHDLASMLLDAGVEITNQPDIVFTGAEPVHDYQKDVIEKAFGTKVADQYGFSEGCGNASQCEYGNYHEDWEFGVLECADAEPFGNGQTRGKIIATGFSNYAFPFIRYEIGDLGVWAPDDYRCPCGRESRVITGIEGRDEDYIITPEGARIMRFDYIFKHAENVKEAQIIQRKLGEVVIKVVPRKDYSSCDQDEIGRSVKEWISPTLIVNIEEVDKIERSASGKFRAVVSELPR